MTDIASIVAKHNESLDIENNPYAREILPGIWVDMYDVLNAFMSDSDEEMRHAAKKVLLPGKRGHKNMAKDKAEALWTISKSITNTELWASNRTTTSPSES